MSLFLVGLLFFCAIFFSFPRMAQAQTALFGDQTVETQPDSNPLGTAEAFQTTASTSGQLNSVNVFIDAASSATGIVIGIYADANGHPGALVTQGNATQLATGTWNSITVTPANLTAGTKYWIAVLGAQSGTLVFRDNSAGSCASETSSQSNLTALPATWNTGSADR